MMSTSPLNQQESNLPPSIEDGVFAEPAPPEGPPEKLTRKQIGQLRRQYYTIVHGTVKACEHKASFSRGHDPKNNCVHCWAAYFATSVDLEFIHTMLTTKGVKELIAMKGTRFVRMFHGFLSSALLPTLAAEINKEEPVRIEGSVFAENELNRTDNRTVENIGVFVPEV